MDGSLTASRVRAVNPRRWRVLALVALLALGACTGQFVYNRLDFVIPFYFGQRVTLAEPQLEQLKSAVQGFTRWHRQSQLTRYSQFARAMAEQASRQSSRAEIEAAALQLERFWDDLMVELLPEGTQWLRGLTPQQVDELLGSYAEDDQDKRGKHCETSPDKLIERRTRSLRKTVKHWSGSLSEPQEAIIARTASAMAPSACASLDNRARWRDEVKRALAQSDPAVSQEHLTVLVLEPERSWTPEYREAFEHNRALIIDMLAQLEDTWTARQRQSIARRLTGIADTLDDLARG